MCKQLLVIFLFTLLFAFSSKAQNAPPSTANNLELKLKNMQDSLQYALGTYIGRFMLNSGFVMVDPDYFLAGLEDIFQKKPTKLKDSVIYSIISNYQSVYQQLLGTRLEEMLFNDLQKKPGIFELSGGVKYEVIKKGNGPLPQLSDSVRVNYKGTLTDGFVFEDTYAKNQSIMISPMILIQGLKDAIVQMPAGSVWKMYIPANKAYADKGNGNIPPYSALIVQLELVEVKQHK